MLRALLLLPLVLAACGGAPEGPNVLVITLDTTRADVLSCYGFPAPSTPNLDALAARSLLFERAYAPMPQTLPSHSTLFTAMAPRRHGAVENASVLRADVETLAELLAARGWDTAAFIGALVLETGTGIEQGFAAFDQPSGVARDSQHPVERHADAVTDSALYWAGRREDPARPWLLWAHYYDPHGPYEPPRERVPLAAVRSFVEERDKAFPGRFSGMELPAIARLWHDYVNEVAEVDAQVGRLLDGLKSRGMLDNTAILVVADHGEGLMEHGEKSHGVTVFEELMRVPLLLCPPGAAVAGRRVAEPLALQDAVPTLLEAAGLPALSADVEGRSHWPQLSGARPWATEPMFVERPHYLPGGERAQRAEVHDLGFGLMAGVVVDDMKLVRFPDKEGRVTETLRDLAADPAELRDVRAERPEELARLQQLLDDWLAAHPAPAPTDGADISPERLEVLKTLGYVGAEGRK